jgi:hypothetical protein
MRRTNVEKFQEIARAEMAAVEGGFTGLELVILGACFVAGFMLTAKDAH